MPQETDEEREARLSRLAGQLKPDILGKIQGEKPKFDSDLVPEVEKGEISEEDLQLDNYLQNYDILQGYRTFIGKMEPGSSGRRTEGIKISCPIPGHLDNDPSAWVNTENNLWFCGGCQTGGDIFDFGAIHFGYQYPDTYKRDGSFPKLKHQMAERLGYVTVTGLSGQKYLLPPPEVTSDSVEGFVAPVLTLHTLNDNEDESELDDDLLKNPDIFIDWENIFTEDTFGWEFMAATTIDDLPHEFYFWQALQALGFALGHKTYLDDFRAVRGNFYICLYGRTGVGKSRSIHPLMEVLKAALPFEDSDPTSAPDGVKIISTPASAEGLLDQFKYEIKDPSTMQTVDLGAVSGLVKIEELSSFIARASRQGSSLRETIMDMYDVFNNDLTLHGRTAGTTRIRDPLVQFITTTQPKAIHAYLRRNDMETGFLNRWDFIAGASRRAPMSYGGKTPDLRKAIEKLKEVKRWAGSGKKMDLHGDGLDIWDNFFHERIAPFKTGEVEMESIMSRIDLHTKKLMVVLTGNEMKDHPTKQTVSQAIKLFPYLSTTFSAFSQDIAFNDVTECQNRIIEIIDKWFQKTGEFPSGREIRQRIGKKYDAEMMIRAMKNLLQLDIITEEVPKQSKRGRPSKYYGLPGLRKA